MSTIVSKSVTPATLQLFITALTNYEPGLTQYIKELCGIHTDQSLDKWINNIFQIRKHYYAMLKEVDELLGQVIKAIPTNKRNEFKWLTFRTQTAVNNSEVDVNC